MNPLMNPQSTESPTNHIDFSIESLIQIAVKKVVGDKLDRIQATLNLIVNGQTYSVDDVAKITGKTPTTIRTHIKKEYLKATQKGKSYTITQDQLNEYLTQN